MSGLRVGLRVGLTGGLGSGKSTAAAMLAAKGAYVLSADELGRSLMQPGQDVYVAIVARFGEGVVRADAQLDRAKLARIAFGGGRVEELNAIVHPATIALQAQEMNKIFAYEPNAVIVVESALIFETRYGETKCGETAPGINWRERFDRLVLVTAPEHVKVARFVARSGGGDVAGLEAEARRRLARMLPDADKAAECDFTLSNAGTLDDLQQQVDALWDQLLASRHRLS